MDKGHHCAFKSTGLFTLFLQQIGWLLYFQVWNWTIMPQIPPHFFVATDNIPHPSNSQLSNFQWRIHIWTPGGSDSHSNFRVARWRVHVIDSHPQYKIHVYPCFDRSLSNPSFLGGLSHLSFPGLAQYSGDPRIEWHLNAFNTKDEVIEAVRNLPYKGGNTLTGMFLSSPHF